ncbi:hypothetical protein TrVE_jg1830 [Triparma verrucosa]|uniref:Uncharacterized protein n=1 Tax=Triparma verrucosa TaxID=1606542 RepID=A0A9W7C912_9STRA|nr:hypothetical protein TrVE_jg1830 [Triparma verrucosa]
MYVNNMHAFSAAFIAAHLLIVTLLVQSVNFSHSLNPLSTGLSGVASSSLSRRALLQTTLATTSLVTSKTSQLELPTPPYNPSQQFPRSLFSYTLLPLTSTLTGNIPTLQSTLIPSKLYSHTQPLGIVNVNTPLNSFAQITPSGLTIINPLQPTPEYLSLLSSLTKSYGPISHIILTSSAVEHRSSFNTFSQYFPDACKYVPEGLYSFPFDLPSEFLGLKGGKVFKLKERLPPDIEVEFLGPFKFKSIGTFVESTLYIPSLKTLISTDTVCSITENVPKILLEDRRGLLYHARDGVEEYVEDREAEWRKGWKRMSLFGLCFFPRGIKVDSVLEAFSSSRKVDSRMKNLDDQGVPFNLYPWKWVGDIDESFKGYGDGKLFVPPILTKLILDREPAAVERWMERVCRWDFDRVVHVHFNEETRAGPEDFKNAIREFLDGRSRFLPGDLALLQEASDVLTKVGVVAESKICDGEKGRGDLGRRFS